jgi:hypothetical protein
MGATDLGHRIHHVAQMHVRVRHREVADRPFFAQRALEARALALGEIQAEAHRVGHGEDVGKQDGGVQLEACQRLQRDLAGQLRVLAQLQEAAGAAPGLVVLGQVASGLAHQPDRGVVDGLAQQGTQEGVVLGAGRG